MIPKSWLPASEPMFLISQSELEEWEAGGMCWAEESDLQQRIRTRLLRDAADNEQYARAWGVVFGLLMQIHPEWDMNKTSDETTKLCDYIKHGVDTP